jgi:hypothetical protein
LFCRLEEPVLLGRHHLGHYWGHFLFHKAPVATFMV